MKISQNFVAFSEYMNFIYYLCTKFKSKVSLGMILLFTWHEVERFSRFFINWLNLPYLPYYYVTRLEHKASISLNSTQFSPKKSRQLLRRLFYDINTVCKIELVILYHFSNNSDLSQKSLSQYIYVFREFIGSSFLTK